MYNIGENNPAILTAKVGDNSDQFPDILALYVPEGSRVLDMTYGKGVFWRKVAVSKYALVTNDIDPELGQHSFDFRDVPFNDEAFDAIILDPPYALRSSNKSGLVGSVYNNAEHGIPTVEGMMKFYADGMREAHRLLVRGGILIVKCQDEISGGKQHWNHITLLEKAAEMGFLSEDLFVLVRKSPPIMRHKRQKHARKNHSFWLVLKKL